jgi:hypothetical protein
MKARVLVERWHRGESVVVKWGEVDDGTAQHFVNMEERRERDKVSALLAAKLEKNGDARARSVRKSGSERGAVSASQ